MSKNVYEYLENLGIEYKKHEHPAVFTCEDAEKYSVDLPGIDSKNLFVTNKKKDIFYLVSLPAEKRTDLNKLAKELGVGRFSFASDDFLMEFLGLTPGSVSPFGLINDVENKVQAIIDEDLLKDSHVQFHPNINTATLTLKTDDFKKYLEQVGNKVEFRKVPERE